MEQAVAQRCFMISQTRHQPYKAGQVKKVKKPEVVAKRNSVRERESSHRSFSEDAEMLSNDRATVTATIGKQLLHPKTMRKMV